MQKFQRLVFVLKWSCICYYRICMTVPLNESEKDEILKIESKAAETVNGFQM